MMKTTFTCLVYLILFSTLIVSETVVADVPAMIRVGVYDNAPKIYTEEDGAVSGFWPDLIRVVAAEEGWKIKWVSGSWAQGLKRLADGDIDIMPDTGWTEPRSRLFQFSRETVLVSWSRLYVQRDSGIESLIDLNGKTVAAMKGSFNLDGPGGIREITRKFELKVTFQEMDSYEQIFEALEKGEIDAGVTNKDFGNQHESEYEIERTPIIFQPGRMQFAFTKDAQLTPYLIDRFDVQLRKLKKDKDSIYYQALGQHIGGKGSQTFIEIIPGWVRIVIGTGGGMILFLFAVGITSRIQVQRRTSELRESEEKYRTVVDNVNEAIFVAQHGKLEYFNPKTVELLEFTENELSTMPFVDIIHPEHKEMVLGRHLRRLKGENIENVYSFKIKTGSGQVRWVEINVVGIHWNNNPATLNFLSDVTERKIAEEKIKASLKEKETLIDEIHHRVKNNMAVIASLLQLQANSVDDNQIKKILRESESRVYAMSAIHEMLHRSENLSEIDLQAYLSRITSSIFQTYSISSDKIKLDNDVEKIPISIDRASPLGLIINELISNSLKYAFPGERKGEITVSLKKLDNEIELIVMDNGIGMPSGLDWKNSKSLGLTLVRNLVENQLDGSINMEITDGTKFVIKFTSEV